MEQLAILGGKPAFDETLHVGAPNIGNYDSFFRRVEAILSSRWLTNRGPNVQELEARICEHLRVKHCITMCNGTVALELAIRALDLSGEVILPPFTFIATAHALRWQQIKPVFCDIDRKTYNLDPDKVESMITPNTTGIIGVHLWGRPCEMNRLIDIAERNNLRILFDAAHAYGCSSKGVMIGNFGDVEVFSFHATKYINTFEGGAITTNNDELAQKLRLMQNFGFAGLDNVIYIGTNGKMSEISAAMGIVSLDSIDQFVEHNRLNYIKYAEELSHVSGVSMIKFDPEESNNFQYIALEVDENIFPVSRDQLITILHAENVRARRYFFPGCHRMEPYRSEQPHAGLLLPNAEEVGKQIVVMPTGTLVKTNDIEKICQIFKLVKEKEAAIREYFASGIAQGNGRDGSPMRNEDSLS